MKLQSLGIVFAIIILPIIIVLSYYINLQVDTIALQSSYDSKLMNATYDALSALELNTANEDLSSVSDSLRSIIEASNSIFFNTLSTNFGVSNASNSYIESYIPAILYTLYDGYYIYSPTKQPKICTYGDTASETWAKNNLYGFTMPSDDDTSKDGQPIYVVPKSGGGYYASETGELLYKQSDGSYSTNIDTAVYETDYILKSYIPYTARYVKDNTDVTINYTLDNHLNIIGTIGNIYYTKTGYLINPNLVTKIDVDGTDKTNSIIGTFYNSSSYTLGYNEETAEDYCLSGEHVITITLKEVDPDDNTKYVETQITANRINLSTVDSSEENRYLSEAEAKEKLSKAYDDYQNYYYEDVISGSGDRTRVNLVNKKIQYLETELENMRAVAYYVSSTSFSRWVYANLNQLEEKDIQMDSILGDESTYSTTLDIGIYADFSESDKKIFDYTQNPEDEDSNFLNHKGSVIRNTVQYNLNLAFSVYSDMSQGKFKFEMPIMSDEEWAKIVTRVSIVSFMQGMPCGTKVYSNYSLVYSSNNEMTVIPEEIYYVKKDNFNDETSETHRIDCPLLEDTTDYIAFTSKELKYDKIYNKSTSINEYDHKNLSCYNCIINKNYEKVIDTSGTEDYGDKINVFALNNVSSNKVKAYYKAVGALRQNLYKTNELTVSEGYSINTSKNYSTGALSTFSNTIAAHTSETTLNTNILDRGINQVKKIQIVLYGLSTNDVNETTVKFNVKINDQYIGSKTLSAAYYSDSMGHPEYVKNQTIELDVDPNLFTSNSTSFTVKLERDNGANKASTLYFDTTYIKVVYK
jgi:hypothetical protein